MTLGLIVCAVGIFGSIYLLDRSIDWDDDHDVL